MRRNRKRPKKGKEMNMKGVKVIKTVSPGLYKQIKDADYIELELIVDNGNQDFDIGDRLYFYRDKYVNEHFD